MTDITQEINKAIAEQNGSVRDALNVALARLLVAQLNVALARLLVAQLENKHLNQDLTSLDFNLRQQLLVAQTRTDELEASLRFIRSLALSDIEEGNAGHTNIFNIEAEACKRVSLPQPPQKQEVEK